MIHVDNVGNGDHLGIRFGGRHFNLVKPLVEGLIDRQWDPEKRHWRIPFNCLPDLIQDLIRLEETSGVDLPVAMSPDARKAYDGWTTTIERRIRMQTELERPVNLGDYFKLPLPKFQQITARFLYMNKRAICGDPTGVGKTCQAIAATGIGFTKNQYSKAIIICKADPTARTKMANEVSKFTHWNPYLVNGSPAQRRRTYKHFALDPDPCYLVLAYSTCRSGIVRIRDEKGRRRISTKDAELNHLIAALGDQKFCLIVDECQKCKHWTSLQTRGVSLLSSRTEHVYGLSATYVEGRLEELHSVFRIIRPNVLGSLYQFMARHVDEFAFQESQRYKRVEEVRRKVRPFVIRRSEREIEAEGALPRIVWVDHRIEPTKNQRALYRQVLDEEQAKREEIMSRRKSKSPGDGIWKMNRERLVCLHPQAIDPTVTDNPKFDHLVELISEQEPTAKFVVFTWFQDVVEMLMERLDEMWPTVGIHGGMKIDREGLRREFMDNPDIRILVASDVWQDVQDLNAARHCVSYDMLWNPAEMTQRAGRVRRRTSTFRQVVAHTMVINRTVEEYIHDRLLVPKQAIMDHVMDGVVEASGPSKESLREIVRKYRG